MNKHRTPKTVIHYVRTPKQKVRKKKLRKTEKNKVWLTFCAIGCHGIIIYMGVIKFWTTGGFTTTT